VNYKSPKPNQISLVLVVSSSAEQYEAYFNNHQIGHLRVRNGLFTLRSPGPLSPIIHEERVGSIMTDEFPEHMRCTYLSIARRFLIQHLKSSKGALINA
jgi:hypothetical protein